MRARQRSYSATSPGCDVRCIIPKIRPSARCTVCWLVMIMSSVSNGQILAEGIVCVNQKSMVYFFGDGHAWIKKNDRQRRDASGDILQAFTLSSHFSLLYCIERKRRRVGGWKDEFQWCLDCTEIIKEFLRGAPEFNNHFSVSNHMRGRQREYFLNLIDEARNKNNDTTHQPTRGNQDDGGHASIGEEAKA